MDIHDIVELCEEQIEEHLRNKCCDKCKAWVGSYATSPTQTSPPDSPCDDCYLEVEKGEVYLTRFTDYED